MVSVPTPTLNALKAMLFSSDEEGISLEGIISDLGGDDMTAINVALAYKGIRPFIDSASRFSHTYCNRFSRFDFKAYSLILGKVFVTETRCHWGDKGQECVDANGVFETSLSLEDWYRYPTTPEKPEPAKD